MPQLFLNVRTWRKYSPYTVKDDDVTQDTRCNQYDEGVYREIAKIMGKISR